LVFFAKGVLKTANTGRENSQKKAISPFIAVRNRFFLTVRQHFYDAYSSLCLAAGKTIEARF